MKQNIATTSGAANPLQPRAADQRFVVVRTLTVRRDFSAGPEAGAVTVNRNCGLGCTCRGTIYSSAGPSVRLAEDKTLCFNDRTHEGISEIAGSAKLVASGPGVTAYEVQAHLKRHNGK